MKLKTFRGLLADGDTQTIRLGTKDGLMGYRVIKFQAFPYDPTNDNLENVIQLWKTQASAEAASVNVDFASPLLLASLFIQNNAGDDTSFIRDTVIFDSEKFNQDIFISNSAGTASNGINYYIELEQVKLDLNEATVATLKNMRGRE